MSALAATFVVGVSCGGNGAHTGNALRATGLQGVFGIRRSYLHAGQIYGFAFPRIQNVSADPITLRSVQLTQLPSAVRVVKYRVLSARETHGVIEISYPGSGDGLDYNRFHDYSQTLSVKAHTVSHFYPVVYVRLMHIARATLSGCLYNYKQGGRLYHQALSCTFRLGG